MAAFISMHSPTLMVRLWRVRRVVMLLTGALVVIFLALSVGPGVRAQADPLARGGGSLGKGQYQLPPRYGVFDYQLGGVFPRLPRYGRIRVVVRDVTKKPLIQAYNICYVNGFQTQPDAKAFWQDHQELLLRDQSGALVIDPNWPDEYVLDPSTKANRTGIVQIIGPIIKHCKAKGFDAVEFDNLDTFTRFEQINKHDALELARDYVRIAHEAGLAVAQKNTAEIAAYAKAHIGFDFAIAESCAARNECGAYKSVYGMHVLQIEYPDTLNAAGLTFKQVCNDPNRAPRTILRDRNLVPRNRPGFIYARC